MADLAFLWHMHQPDYRHPETGHFTLPWALLHALKDYPDMASHLERHPAIRCTVNFVPVLLAQIEDYCDQLATRQWRDPLLRILAWPNPDQLEQADRDWLLDMAFRCHAPTSPVHPYPCSPRCPHPLIGRHVPCRAPPPTPWRRHHTAWGLGHQACCTHCQTVSRVLS